MADGAGAAGLTNPENPPPSVPARIRHRVTGGSLVVRQWLVAGLRLAGHNGIVTYRMYSPAGDEAVADLVFRARLVISAGLHRDAAQAWIREHRDKIKRAHGEITDTVVRQEIAAALGPDWQAAYGCKFDEWLGITPDPIAVNGPF